MARAVVVCHSGYGHTKLQAEAVHRGAAGVAGIEAELVTTAQANQGLDSLDRANAMGPA
jgi:NAD(P)H dehydrogenase (quinone)